MKWNLIFEGCDCVGKTSIINELQPLFNQIVKMNQPKGYEDAKSYYFEFKNYLNNNVGILLDRGFLGEEIYGPLKRGYNVEYMRNLELELNDNNVIIIVTADVNKIKNRFDGDFLKIEELEVVDNWYNNVYNKVNYSKKLLVDSTDLSPKQLANSIIRILKKWEKENL